MNTLSFASKARGVAHAARLLATLYDFATQPARLDIDRYARPTYQRVRRELTRDLRDFQRLFADLGGTTAEQVDAAIDPQALIWRDPVTALSDRRSQGADGGWSLVEPATRQEGFRLAACQLLGRLVYEREYVAVRSSWPSAWAENAPYFRLRTLENLRHRYGPGILRRWVP